MAQITSQLLVRLIDGVSAPARAAAAALRGIGTAARTAMPSGIGGAQASLRTAIQSNNQAMADMRGRMVEAAAGGFILQRALSAVIRPAVEFESALADVGKVTSFNDADLATFGGALRRIATTDIPMAVNELAALAAAAAQSGVPESELLDFTRLTARAGVAWGVTGAAAGEALAKLRSALGLTNEQTARYADAINHLSDNTAASAPDLLDYARRVASAGEFFGISRQQSLAFGAAMIGAGAQSDVAATSFRNMGRALTRGASATTTQQRAYRALGLNARTVAQSMQRDAVGTITDVIARIGRLPRAVQAANMSDLFGDEARALAPLIGNADLLRRALGMVADETTYAGSVTREFERRARTTEYTWQRFKSQMTDVALVIGGALLPALRDIMNALGPMILRFSAFAEANPRLISTIVALATGLIGLRVAMIAASFAGLMMKGSVLSLLLGLTNVAAGVAGVARLLVLPFAMAGARLGAIFTMIATRFVIMRALMSTGSIGLGGVIAGAFSTMGRAMLMLINPMALVRAGLFAIRLAVIGTGIGAIFVAIAAAGAFIYNNWSGIQAMFVGIGQGIRAAFPGAGPIIDAISSALSTLFGWFTSITGTLDYTEEQWRAFGESIGTAIGDGINAAIEWGRNLLQWLGALPGRAWTAISSGAASLYAAGIALLQRLWDGAQTKFAEAVAWAGTLPWRLGEALASAAGALLAAGGAIIQSLWDGAQAKFGEVLAWFAALPGRIVAAVGNIDLSGVVRMPAILGGAAAPPPGVARAAGAAGAMAGGVGGAPTAGAPPARASGAPTAGAPPARAAGGPVTAGQPYIVGERRPELFVPGQSGRIEPRVPAGGGGTTNIAPSFTFNITGGGDARAIADEAARMMESRLRDLLRGLQADTGFATP